MKENGQRNFKIGEIEMTFSDEISAKFPYASHYLADISQMELKRGCFLGGVIGVPVWAVSRLTKTSGRESGGLDEGSPADIAR